MIVSKYSVELCLCLNSQLTALDQLLALTPACADLGYQHLRLAMPNASEADDQGK